MFPPPVCWIFDFNFISSQQHMPAAPWCQPQIALASYLARRSHSSPVDDSSTLSSLFLLVRYPFGRGMKYRHCCLRTKPLSIDSMGTKVGRPRVVVDAAGIAARQRRFLAHYLRRNGTQQRNCAAPFLAYPKVAIHLPRIMCCAGGKIKKTHNIDMLPNATHAAIKITHEKSPPRFIIDSPVAFSRCPPKP